jgi:ribonucleoside-diphosphate reductase beta chain
MFRYTLRDESNHIELFRRLLLELAAENPEIWTPVFRAELRELMAEAVELDAVDEQGAACGARACPTGSVG